MALVHCSAKIMMDWMPIRGLSQLICVVTALAALMLNCMLHCSTALCLHALVHADTLSYRSSSWATDQAPANCQGGVLSGFLQQLQKLKCVAAQP